MKLEVEHKMHTGGGKKTAVCEKKSAVDSHCKSVLSALWSVKLESSCAINKVWPIQSQERKLE